MIIEPFLKIQCFPTHELKDFNSWLLEHNIQPKRLWVAPSPQDAIEYELSPKPNELSFYVAFPTWEQVNKEGKLVQHHSNTAFGYTVTYIFDDATNLNAFLKDVKIPDIIAWDIEPIVWCAVRKTP